MIFKTFDSDIDKMSSKWCVFGKSFADIGSAIFGRINDINKNFQLTDNLLDAFNNSDSIFERLYSSSKIKPLNIEELFPTEKLDSNFDFSYWIKSLSDMDKNAKLGTKTWQEYSDELENSQKWIAEFGQATEGTIRTEAGLTKAYQEARQSAISFNAGLQKTTLGAKAAELGMKALAVAGNMFVSFMISEGISLIYDFANAENALAEKSSKLGSEFKSTKSEIEGYQKRIEECRKTIETQTSSYSDVVDARKEVLSIQNEMIEKYGSESDSIDLVTEAINGNINAFEKLTAQSWDETKIEFDKHDGYKGLIVDNFLNRNYNGSNFERMIDEVENASTTFSLMAENTDKYKEFIDKLKELYNAEYTMTDHGVSNITIDGNLDEVYDKLLAIKSLAKSYDIDWTADLTDAINKTKSKLDDYKDIYNQHVLNDIIFGAGNDKYASAFKEANDAYEKYNQAVINGNEKAAESAKEEYAQLVSGFSSAFANDENGQAVIDYFSSMYPELEAIVQSWNFKAKITPVFSDGSDNPNYDAKTDADLKGIVDKFQISEDLLNFNRDASTDQEMNDAYDKAKQIATDYFDGSLEQLAKFLIEMYGMGTQDQLDFVEKFQHMKKRSGSVNANQTTAESWYDSLSDDDKELANSSEFIDKIEQMQKDADERTNKASAALQSAKENLEEEYTKIFDWDLDEYASKIQDGSIQTKFGNVDMDKRTIIKWSNELKQTYKDELASWDYNPTVGSIDTVFGSSARFGTDLNGTGWEVAFTPILPDGRFLSSDTVYDYIESILKDAYADDGKVTDGELKDLDAQGRMVGDTFVKGIYAGVDDSMDYSKGGNWANIVGALMHFVGNFGAVPLAKQSIDEESAAMDEATVSAEDYSNALQELKNSQQEVNVQPTTLTEKIYASKDAIDKFESSVNSAYEAYKTLTGVNVSSSDMLSSIMSITSALKDMGADLNWDFIDNAETLGRVIESISKKYANSILTGAGIDTDSKFGKLLADNIVNARKAAAELDNVNSAIDSLQSAYSSLTEIIENYNETGYITFDQLQTLLAMEPDYLSCLVDENGQLQLNQSAVEALANQRLNDARAQAVAQAIAELGQLTLKAEQTAAENNGQAFEDQITHLSNYSQSLATVIGQAALGTEVIGGLNAALDGAKDSGVSEEDIQTVMDNLQKKLDLINTVQNTNISKTLGGGGGKSSGGSKSETDEYLENFEKMQDKLKDLYDQGKITTKQYYDALRALAEKYLKDREKYADKLAEIEQEYAKGMKELYDTVISGIISKIDKRISALNDQKDAAVSALEAEEKAAKKTLEAQKEALQVEIDAIDKQISSKQELIDSINDEADAKQRAYDLDKAQYELDRLRNQKTIYEYSGKEKGFIYKTDDKAIRDQEQEVDDKKREIRIANIEKEISALEKRKSALEEQQNAIDDQIDAISDYYEELIANTEAYWDEIIKGMEETKTKWEELQELQENAELEMNLRSLGYEGGIDEVLALTDEQFAQFKNNYLQYIAGMNQGNQSFIDSLSQISGVDIGNLPDIFKETQEYIDMLGQGIDFTALDSSLGGVIDGFTEIANNAKIATGAVIGGTATTAANSGSSGNKNGEQGGNGQSSSGSGDSLNDGIKTMSEESVPKINDVANAFAGSEEGEDTGTSVAGSAQKASKAISSGKDSGGEEDESLQGAIKTQVEAAVDPDKGLPAEQRAWSELDSVIASIAENLAKINSEIDKLANKKVGNIFSGLGISIGGGAQVDGTAFASGTLGKVSDNGVALGGELGREMVVRDGKFFTVGDNGAELFHHKKGDIIFNHKQTQDILEKGHTNSRGKAFAGGNVNGLPKEYSLPSQEVMDRMAKLEAGFNSLNKDESLLVQMQIRDNTKKIYEQNARAIQEVQKFNKSNSTNNTYNYSIDAIELPNVMNGEDFYRDIRRLNTLIKQQGNTRK